MPCYMSSDMIAIYLTFIEFDENHDNAYVLHSVAISVLYARGPPVYRSFVSLQVTLPALSDTLLLRCHGLSTV